MSCWSINHKRTHDSKTFPKWQSFIWSAKVLVKTLKNVLEKKSTSPMLPPKTLECKIFINIINIIVLINVALLMKNIQDSSINSKNFDFSYYQNFMPSCRTYLILFVVRIWINLNKYCYSCWFLFNKIM
jgi:hypothetical protein